MKAKIHLVRDRAGQAFQRLQPLFFACVLLALSNTPASAIHTGKLIIAAANSTCSAVRAAGAAFSARNDIEVEYICKSSGRLAKGLIGGAITADYYISANARWMDVMVNAGQVQNDAVQSLWGNELVVATPQITSLTVNKLADLSSNAVERIYIGDPSTAPFGRYTKQALQNAGVWEAVKQKITTQKHITLLAQNLSQASEASIGILFSTNLTPELRTQLSIESNLHDPIHYFSAPLAGVGNQDLTHAFDAFLKTDTARNMFRDHGFKILPEPMSRHAYKP